MHHDALTALCPQCGQDTFRFSDRTLSLQDILELGGAAVNFTLGPDITGTDNADVIQGTDKAEHIYALAGDDTIDAGAGNDTIEGGDGGDSIDGGAGADVMKGGYGDDTYYVDNAGDRIIEDFGQTITYQALDAQGVLQTYSFAVQDYETVNASISYALGTYLENLNLTGTGDIDGTGNELDNYITGNDGNNILSGGACNDTFYDRTGDRILRNRPQHIACAGRRCELGRRYLPRQLRALPQGSAGKIHLARARGQTGSGGAWSL